MERANESPRVHLLRACQRTSDQTPTPKGETADRPSASGLSSGPTFKPRTYLGDPKTALKDPPLEERAPWTSSAFISSASGVPKDTFNTQDKSLGAPRIPCVATCTPWNPEGFRSGHTALRRTHGSVASRREGTVDPKVYDTLVPLASGPAELINASPVRTVTAPKNRSSSRWVGSELHGNAF